MQLCVNLKHLDESIFRLNQGTMMENNFRQFYCLFGCSLLLSCIISPLLCADSKVQMPQMYIIGDSTAASYDRDRYPLTGWAQVMQTYFDPQKLVVNDKARSGRSSKSFMEEGAWAAIRENLRPGDFVLIQFGHNDSKQEDPKRYTEPDTTYKEYLNTYIDETLATGATPILTTSINRNVWGEDGSFKDTMGDYPDAVRALAAERTVALVDAHQLTRELYETLGREKATSLFMNVAPGIWPHYPEGREDNTHLRETGAHVVCRLIVEALTQQEPSLADALSYPIKQIAETSLSYAAIFPVETEHTYGSYIVRTYAWDLRNTEGAFEILRDGIPRYTARGYSFRIGTLLNDGNVHPLISPGDDITHDGQPNLVIMESTGGAHCCFFFHLFEIGRQFRRIQTINALDGNGAYFVNLDNDPALEFVMDDWSFAYWKTAFAFSPHPEVILKYGGQRYDVAAALMRKPALPDVELEQIGSLIEASPEWQQKQQPPVDLWATMLDFIYAGNMEQAWKLFDLSWPEEISGKQQFLKEFNDQLSQSLFRESIEKSNNIPDVVKQK